MQPLDLQFLIHQQAHIVAYTQAMGKHHAKQLILPVRAACIAHVKTTHISQHEKHSCVGRTPSTYLQQTTETKFGIQNKTRPPFCLMTVLDAHLTPAMQQDTDTSSAGQPLRKRSHFQECFSMSVLSTLITHTGKL